MMRYGCCEGGEVVEQRSNYTDIRSLVGTTTTPDYSDETDEKKL